MLEKKEVRAELTERTPLTTTAKWVIFLAGISNPFLGYALFFVLYDTDREKAQYFRSGAKTGIVVTIIAGIACVILEMNGIDTGIFS